MASSMLYSAYFASAALIVLESGLAIASGSSITSLPVSALFSSPGAELLDCFCVPSLAGGGLVFGASRHGGAHGFQGLSQSDTRQQKTKTGRGKPVERGHKTHVFFPFSGRLLCRLFDHAQASGRIPLFLPAVKPY